jgi:putative restriction endonuclease
MIDQEFEGPLFKILSKNDTAQAPGHQAGVVIPVDLRPFFPTLSIATQTHPVPSVALKVILVLDDGTPQMVATNYKLQTWKLTRRETRITGNLQHIRSAAHPKDLLLIERGRENANQFRLTLLRQGTALYDKAMGRTKGRRWGALTDVTQLPADEELTAASAEVDTHTAAPFEPFEADAPLQPTAKRIARSRAFRTAVTAAYGNCCAMCGGGARSPIGASEVEAAHVIPRAQKGSDDVRNGIALCRLHHWAFDHQLVGVTAAGVLRVAPAAAALPENVAIGTLNGAPLLTTSNPALRLHQIAIEWSEAAFDRFWQEGL